MTIKGQNELPILRVAKPCTEDWEQMVGDDRVRYCAKCELSVYNFADMTRDEIAELVARREGRICGRLYRRQDGTVVTKECDPEVRAKYGDLTRWAAMALSAAMSVTMVSAQTKPAPAATVAEQAKNADSSSIQLVDTAGASISRAQVILTSKETKERYEGTTGEDGTWSTMEIAPGNYTLRVEVRGFASVKMLVKLPGKIMVKMGPDYENLEMGVIASEDGIGLETEAVQLPDVINPVPEPKKP